MTFIATVFFPGCRLHPCPYGVDAPVLDDPVKYQLKKVLKVINNQCDLLRNSLLLVSQLASYSVLKMSSLITPFENTLQKCFALLMCLVIFLLLQGMGPTLLTTNQGLHLSGGTVYK